MGLFDLFKKKPKKIYDEEKNEYWVGDYECYVEGGYKLHKIFVYEHTPTQIFHKDNVGLWYDTKAVMERFYDGKLIETFKFSSTYLKEYGSTDHLFARVNNSDIFIFINEASKNVDNDTWNFEVFTSYGSKEYRPTMYFMWRTTIYKVSKEEYFAQLEVAKTPGKLN